jgi:hypothetical protein
LYPGHEKIREEPSGILLIENLPFASVVEKIVDLDASTLTP